MKKKFKPFKDFSELTKKQQESLSKIIPKKDRPYACCFTYGHKAYTLRQMTDLGTGTFSMAVDGLSFWLELSEGEANEYTLEVYKLDVTKIEHPLPEGVLFAGTVDGFLDFIGAQKGNK